MAKPLTAKSINNLRPKVDAKTGKRQPNDLFDGGGGQAVKGLLVRVNPGGNKYFYVQFRRPNHVKKRGTGELVFERNSTRLRIGKCKDLSLTDARKRAALAVHEARNAVVAGLYGEDVRQYVNKKLLGLTQTPQEISAASKKKHECPTVEEFIDNHYASQMLSEGLKTFQDNREIERLKYVLRVLSLPPKKGPDKGKKGKDDLNLLAKKLHEVDRHTIKRWKMRRLSRVSDRTGQPPSKVTVSRELMMMRSLFNEAIDCGHIAVNPLDRISRSKKKGKSSKSKKRDGLLNDEQEQRLVEALERRETELRKEHKRAFEQGIRYRKKPPSIFPEDKFVDFLRPIILIAMNTGLRFGEIASLTWGDVKLNKNDKGEGLNQLTLRDTKNDEELTMPLNTEAVQVLRKWKSWPGKPVASIDPDALVFEDYKGDKLVDIRRYWLPVFQDAGLPKGYRFHDLRHHFASKLVSMGTPLFAVQVLLNHSSPAMTERYAHHAPGYMESVVEQLSREKK